MTGVSLQSRFLANVTGIIPSESRKFCRCGRIYVPLYSDYGSNLGPVSSSSSSLIYETLLLFS